jgi:hypothetical protein
MPDLRLNTNAPLVVPDAAWLASLPWRHPGVTTSSPLDFNTAPEQDVHKVERVERPAGEAVAPSSGKPPWLRAMPGTAEAEAPIAGIPLFITQEQKRQLAERSFTAEQIRNMKPEEAHRILGVAPEASAVEAEADPAAVEADYNPADYIAHDNPEAPSIPPTPPTPGPEAPKSDTDIGAADPPRGRYIKTADARQIAKGRGADVLRALKISWPPAHGDHITCPVHDDHDPSFRWDESKGCAFCTCDISGASIFDVVMRVEGIDFEAAKIRVAEVLNRDDLIIDPNTERGVTVEEMAVARKLPEEFLFAQGWRDLPKSGKYHNRAAISIPYADAQNRKLWLRIRVKPSGKGRSVAQG